MPLQRPTLSDLRARIAADIDGRLPGADSRLRRSMLEVLARVLAGALDSLYGLAVWLAEQLMPDTASAEYLARWASIWGIARKPAVAASGNVTVTGLIGATVPFGAELTRIDGARFTVTARTVLVATTATVPVEATAPGADGAVSAGTVLTFASPLSGVNATAVSVAGLGGGADEEDDAALLARLLTRIRNPPNGGSSADWVEWAKEVPGVTRAWSFENWTGPGRVGLTFVYDDRDDILPSEDDLELVAAYIETVRPVIATPVIFAPIPQPLNPVIRLRPDTDEVRAAVTAELADLFAREAEPGGVILKSHLDEAASVAAGETDHLFLSPVANVTTAPGYMPMLGAITWAP